MPVDLTALEPGQIVLLTVAATIIASVVGAIAAFVVATVNAYAASRLVRETARREHRLRTITPYLEHLDNRIALYEELMDAGGWLSAGLNKFVELVKAEQKEKAQDAWGEELKPRLTDLAKRLKASQGVYRTGWFSVVISDQRVLDRQHDWIKKDGAFIKSFVATGGFTTNPEKLKNLKKLASEALDVAVAARLAIEDFVFGGRSWIRRGLYNVWSKVRDAWKKDHPQDGS